MPNAIVPFNPEKHCGASVNYRNPEKLKKTVQRAKRELNALKPSAEEYDLKKQRYEQIIRIAHERLAKYEKQPDQRPCCLNKGYRTDHLGEGYCHFHCQCHGRAGYHNVTGNLYRHIKHRQLQDALSLVENQTLDIMDLVPEVKMLKALAIVFFEDIGHRENLTTKDIETAANLIGTVGKMVERISAIRLKAGTVPFDTIYELTREMGRRLQGEVNAANGKVLDGDAFMEAVSATWRTIAIDVNARPLPLPAHSREAT